ncbi:MAG TPA: hypothetical protein VKH44_09770 [Pirellulaceae bacterium]|nr:hypothetical protein [Pirellulaceae bacterium]
MSDHPQPWQASPLTAQGANPFAEVVNPYAAPQEVGYYPPQSSSAPPFAGLWRQGKLLVMHKRAPLPDICLKSNQPATRRLKRKLQWHHPAIALTILAGLLVYIILAVVLTKRATIYVALTDEWFAIRWRRILYAWLVALLSVVLFIVGVAFVDQANTPIPAFSIIGSCLLFLCGLIYGQYAPSLVSPKRMTDDYIWLKGVHPDFLDRLEVWQWNI